MYPLDHLHNSFEIMGRLKQVIYRGERVDGPVIKLIQILGK